MPKVPPLRARKIIAALAKLGFEEIRQRGSHKQFRHADGRQTTVPVHQGRDVAPVLIRKICKDIGLEIGDLLELL